MQRVLTCVDADGADNNGVCPLRLRHGDVLPVLLKPRRKPLGAGARPVHPILRHPPLGSLCSSAIVLTPAPIGAIATSGYDFREGQPFAIAPRGEAACHSSS